MQASLIAYSQLQRLRSQVQQPEHRKIWHRSYAIESKAQLEWLKKAERKFMNFWVEFPLWKNISI
jgi:hypothetical protein